MAAIRGAGRGWQVVAAIAAALALVGCEGGDGSGGTAGAGGTGGSGGSGGSGGTGGGTPDVETLCLGTCEPLVECEYLPAENLQDCVDLCVEQTRKPEDLVECVACLEAGTCDDVLGSCQEACAPESWDLTVTWDNTGSDEPAGELVVSAFDTISGLLWMQEAVRVEAGAEAEAVLAGALQSGRPVRVDAFLDVDFDGSCGDGDRTFRVEIESPAEPVTIALDPEAAAVPDACDSFVEWPRDVRYLGSGFDTYDGKPIVFVLRAEVAGNPMGAQTESVIADGDFSYTFDDMLYSDASEYRMAWFVDVDGDGRCSSADLGDGMVIEAPFDAHAVLLSTPDDAGAPECSLFYGLGQDLVVEGSGYDTWEGASILGVLVEAATGEMNTYASGLVQNGAFELSLPRSLAQQTSYELSLWIDLDDDGECGEGDAVWWAAEIPAAESAVTVEVTPGTFDLTACEAQPHGGAI